MKKSEKEKLEEAKAKAKQKVGTVSVDTIKFKKGGGTGIIFEILSKAKGPLSLKELTARAGNKGITPSRAKTVANWFASHNIATKTDGKYALKPFKQTNDSPEVTGTTSTTEASPAEATAVVA